MPRFSLSLRLLLCSVVLMLAPRSAVAAPTGATWHDPAHAYELLVDACIFSSAPDVCERNSMTGVWECKAERLASGGQGAIMTMIKNWSDEEETDLCDGYDYCAFGAIKTGGGPGDEETFYCAWDGDDIDEMSLTGTGYEDRLYFHHSDNGEFDMEEHAGVADVTGHILGLGGDDFVHGSRHDSVDYFDVLRGSDGDDVIWGHDGADLIYAGGGDDIIWAGPGPDTVHLDAGNNHCSTEDGNDTVYGGTGIDNVHLGAGIDYADGAGSGDFLCGGSENDLIEGGANDDELWGGDGSSDSAVGGPGTNSCKAETETDCSGTPLLTQPDECPDEHEGTPAG